MLRKLFIKNFVLFEDEFRLDFTEDTYFVIGANNTGKSSLFESIRRCLSTSRSTTLSSAFDKNKFSLVCAHFKRKDEDIISAIIGFPKPENKTMYIKMVNKISGVNESRAVDLVKENLKGTVVNEEYEVTSENATCFNLLKRFVNQDINSMDFINEVENLLKTEEKEFLKKNGAVTENTKCNSILKKLDTQVVNTFPNRGIGPLQWSLSKLVRASEKEKNYEYAQNMAEIITWFEENKQHQKITNVELEREKEYYKIITSNNDLQFKLIGGKLKCCKHGTNDREKGMTEKEVFLLKVPEGYLEAKHCSILLAVDCFKTVILEDPEKGMHPQMIERLRDLVLPRVKDKVVLVSSHHPHFVCFSNINRVFLLRPVQKAVKRTSNIISVGSIVNPQDVQGVASSESSKKKSYCLSSSDFRSILYAERVIIVEGKYDVMFVESVKHLLLADEKNGSRRIRLSDFVDDAGNEEKIKEIKSDLATLVIHPAGGLGDIDELVELCYKLQIEACSLKDDDKTTQEKSELNTEKANKPRPQKTDQAAQSAESDDQLEEYKKDYGFIWKKGNIEDAFESFKIWLSDDEFENKLKKVLGKYRGSRKKFGRIGTVSDRNDVVLQVLEISGKKDITNEDGNEFRRFVIFLVNFLLHGRIPVKTLKQ